MHKPTQLPSPWPNGAPVELLLRECRKGGKWPYWSGSLEAVLPAERVVARHCDCLLDSADERLYRWQGLVLHLFFDELESYYYNLRSEQPQLQLICEPDSSPLQPQKISASPDEGNASLEVEGCVLSAPIEARLYRWLERYVLAHYQPERRYKRQRKDWRT